VAKQDLTLWLALNLGFPGQYYDAETSAWNNGFRDYKSTLGRYVESDPLGLTGGTNTYAYVDGNPLSYTDPYGLTKYTQVPANAVQYVSGSGVSFYAPPRANFGAMESAGQIYGSNPIATLMNEGQGGTYDFQRNNGDFYTQYSNASNYGVGVYLFSAGYSADEAIDLGEEFATFFSSNAGDGTQVYWWLQGWNDAANGALAKKKGCP
jgi:RHS repeat-associated protein